MQNASLLQYFRPALSFHLSLRPSFYLFLNGPLRQVWLYCEQIKNQVAHSNPLESKEFKQKFGKKSNNWLKKEHENKLIVSNFGNRITHNYWSIHTTINRCTALNSTLVNGDKDLFFFLFQYLSIASHSSKSSQSHKKYQMEYFFTFYLVNDSFVRVFDDYWMIICHSLIKHTMWVHIKSTPGWHYNEVFLMSTVKPVLSGH